MNNLSKRPRRTLGLTIILVFAAGTAKLRAADVQVGTPERDGTTSFWGLVLPGRADDTFLLRGRFGTLTVKLGEDTVLGYDCFRSLNVEKRMVRPWFFGFSIPALGDKVIEKQLPKDLYVRKTYHPADTAVSTWQKDFESGKLRFIDGVFATSLGLHLPTQSEPWFSARIEGLIDPKSRTKTYYSTVQGKKLVFGLGTYPLLWGVITRQEIEPYAFEAKVFGTRKGGTVFADRVAIRPIGDPVKYENPKLPRYLFIGDSISVGYNSELRRLLDGKVNLYHPHTNCGPSGKGVGRIDAWLGAHEEPGRGWDVISFNFGHWDAGNSKDVYQRNFEEVISKLKNTGAELIYITTAPVPEGYPPAGGLIDRGAKGMCAPGRAHGVMEKYINPWALEVIHRYPEIVICDHWKIVKDGEEDIYQDWWQGKNVHFQGTKLNTALAQPLAGKVLQSLKQRHKRIKGGWTPTIRPPRNSWE